MISIFSLRKIAVIGAFICCICFGLRTYWLYNQMLNAATYRESVELVMRHKKTFLFLYKLKPLQEKIVTYWYGSPAKKSVSESLEDWLEARIMYHIEYNPEITQIKQLPCMERNVLRALDGSSYVSSLARQGLYYVTGSNKK